MDARLHILKDTFEQRFDDGRFLRFATEFFGSLKTISPDRDIVSIPKEYQFTVESYRHLASYVTGGDTIDIFTVRLQSGRGRTVERARSMQRSFISKLLSNTNHDGAIVAFYTDDDPRWRLSFIRLDYEFAEGRVKMSLTPARRYSYLVGENEPYHTAMEQLYPIFRDENFNPTLDRIEEAFSVERVTKDFFERYKEKYFVLKEHLDGSEVFNEEAVRCSFTSEQFAKKLMGQLAFLYFLQKKGWLGIGVLPHKLTEKEYKNAFYATKASREVVPQIYQPVGPNDYRLDIRALQSLSDDDADIAAGCFKSADWGTGEKAFVRHLFTSCKLRNFFDNYLEPLFYEALNQKRGKNSFYKRFNCKIPFLNGGLFEPLEGYDWQHNKFGIPNELFSNVDIKGNRDADGILDIFDRYNFTMNEDEPLEREVAVDPEMLGKIFENLLDASDRKSKGAFYTPREIVHYMCAESLVNYLVGKTGVPYDDMKAFISDGEFMKDEDYNNRGERKLPQSVYDKLRETDKALETIKVADPAVGSGAFPLGMLSEIVKARNNITYYYAAMLSTAEERARLFEQREPYSLKWQTIQNSIFAVDIEASAVDIAKLRLWLSLVVDEDLTPTYDEQRWGDAKQKDPRPLPNLDYNIMCGNSLIDEFEGIQLFDDALLGKGEYDTSGAQKNVQTSLFIDSMQIYLNDLHREQERLFGEQNQDTKREIKKNIDKTIDSMIRAKLQRDDNSNGLLKYEESLKEKTKPYFLWKLEFAHVFQENGGFDVVIGNPPYVGESGHKEIFRPVASTDFGKRFYIGKMDLFYFFFHRGIDILTDKGFLGFITTNYYPTADGARKLRADLYERTNLIELINFNEYKIFETALGQHNLITLLQKSPHNPERVVHQTFVDEKGGPNHNFLLSILSRTAEKVSYLNNRQCNIFDGDNRYIRFASGEIGVDSLLNKMATAGIPLGENFNVNQGVVPGAMVFTNAHAKKFPEINASIGEPIFIFPKGMLKELSDSESDEYIKPFFKNSDIHRYVTSNDSNKELIYADGIQKVPNTIIKYLERFKPLLIERREFRDGRRTWYNLHWPREQQLFDGEKIVLPYRTKNNTFAYSNKAFYASTDVYFITERSEKIGLLPLLAILNSKLMFLWLFNKGKRKGEILELFPTPINEIPIVMPEDNVSQCLTTLTTQIIERKRENLLSDTSALEAEIDRMVYELYGLTEDEIKIVEENTK